MIFQAHDVDKFIKECRFDLCRWSDGDTDWHATLAQPEMTLLTDGEGSYALVERLDHNIIEAHVIISAGRRGKLGQGIAVQMLDWIDRHLPYRMMMAKTEDRATRLWLRRLGFSHEGQHGDADYFSRWRP